MIGSLKFRGLEKIVPFVENHLKPGEGSLQLTLTIEQIAPEVYCVDNVTVVSDTTSPPSGSEQQQTTSKTPHSVDTDTWDDEGGYYGRDILS